MSTIKKSVLPHVDQTSILTDGDKAASRINAGINASMFNDASSIMTITDKDDKIDIELDGIANLNIGNCLNFGYDYSDSSILLSHQLVSAVAPGAYKVGADIYGHLTTSLNLITADDVTAATNDHTHGNLDNTGHMTNTEVDISTTGKKYLLAIGEGPKAAYSSINIYLMYASNLYFDYNDTTRENVYLSRTMEFLAEPTAGNGIKVTDSDNKYIDLNYDTTQFGVSGSKAYLKNPHTWLSDYSSACKDTDTSVKLYKFSCSKYGHILKKSLPTLSDFTTLGLSSSDTTYTFADGASTLGAINFNGKEIAAKNIGTIAGYDYANYSNKTASEFTGKPVLNIESISGYPNYPLKWLLNSSATGALGLALYDKPLGNLAFANGVDDSSIEVSDSYIQLTTGSGSPFNVNYKNITFGSGTYDIFGVQAENNVDVGDEMHPVYYSTTNKAFAKCGSLMNYSDMYLNPIFELSSGALGTSGIASCSISGAGTYPAEMGTRYYLITLKVSGMPRVAVNSNLMIGLRFWIGTAKFSTASGQSFLNTAPNSGAIVIPCGNYGKIFDTSSSEVTLMFTINGADTTNFTINCDMHMFSGTTTPGTLVTSSNYDTYFNDGYPPLFVRASSFLYLGDKS